MRKSASFAKDRLLGAKSGNAVGMKLNIAQNAVVDNVMSLMNQANPQIKQRAQRRFNADFNLYPIAE